MSANIQACCQRKWQLDWQDTRRYWTSQLQGAQLYSQNGTTPRPKIFRYLGDITLTVAFSNSLPASSAVAQTSKSTDLTKKQFLALARAIVSTISKLKCYFCMAKCCINKVRCRDILPRMARLGYQSEGPHCKGGYTEEYKMGPQERGTRTSSPTQLTEIYQATFYRRYTLPKIYTSMLQKRHLPSMARAGRLGVYLLKLDFTLDYSVSHLFNMLFKTTAQRALLLLSLSSSF